MTRIRSVLVVGLMTADTSCRKSGVIPVNVTIHTLPRRDRVGTRKWKSRIVMVESGVSPHTGVVTHFTLLRESGSHVIWIRRSLKILEMAGHASGTFELVVVVDMAVGTLSWRHGV